MKHFCDSNFLVALVTRRHFHHEEALAWWNALTPDDSIAICRASQLAFLRLITTQAIMQTEKRTNLAAQVVLENLLQHPMCEFLAGEPPDLEARWLEFSSVNSSSPKLWMDAYLAAFALGYRMRFVTFDKGFERYRKHGLDLLVLKKKK
jgi:uncharacterized protein